MASMQEMIFELYQSSFKEIKKPHHLFIKVKIDLLDNKTNVCSSKLAKFSLWVFSI